MDTIYAIMQIALLLLLASFPVKWCVKRYSKIFMIPKQTRARHERRLAKQTR